MKIAIVGASGKTGRALLAEATSRGHRVAAVCRSDSASKLDAWSSRDDVEVFHAPVISEAPLLRQALAGCEAVVAIPITVRDLRAPALVEALIEAADANGVRRAIFTSGEVTSHRAPGERYTPRQWALRILVPPLVVPTPWSIFEMLRASALIREHDWNWTIVRAPTLVEGDARGSRHVELHEVTGRHRLTRADYARAMLDAIDDESQARRLVTVVGE